MRVLEDAQVLWLGGVGGPDLRGLNRKLRLSKPPARQQFLVYRATSANARGERLWCDTYRLAQTRARREGSGVLVGCGRPFCRRWTGKMKEIPATVISSR